MPDFRRPRSFATYPAPTNQRITSNLEHDFRDFGPGFDPNAQPDEFEVAKLRKDIRARGIIDIGAYLDYLAATNMPPQLVQGPFPQNITAPGQPVLLIPKNRRRQSWRVSNWTNAGVILYSFGYPISFGNLFAGIPVPAQDSDEELNGSVSINDIWIWTNDPQAALTYPIPVLGYEGGLSIAGNKA